MKQTSLLPLASFVFFFFLHCGPKEHKNLSGEDSSMGILLGQGFHHLTWTPKGHCVKIQNLETQSGEQGGQIASFRMLEISSLTDLKSALNISASASLKFGVFGSGSGSFQFSEKIQKNSQSRYLLVHTRVSQQLELAKDFMFTESAQKVLKSQGIKKFTESCGTQFAYGRRKGGEFFAVFEFENLTQDQDRSFSLAIKAVGSGWKGSSEIRQSLSQFQQNTRVQYSVYRVGGKGELPEVKNLENFGLQFPHLIGALSKDQVTIEILTKDYSGVEPMDLSPNLDLFDRQTYVIQEISKRREAAKESLQDIFYIKNHPNDYIHHESLDSKEKDLSFYINKMDQAAIQCFQDIFNGCALPSEVYPIMILPKKKRFCDQGFVWSEETNQCLRYELHNTCAFSDSQNHCLAYEGFKPYTNPSSLEYLGEDDKINIPFKVQTFLNPENKNQDLFLSSQKKFEHSLLCSGKIVYMNEFNKTESFSFEQLVIYPESFFGKTLLQPLSLEKKPKYLFEKEIILSCRSGTHMGTLPKEVCLHSSYQEEIQKDCESSDIFYSVAIRNQDIYLGPCLCSFFRS